MSEITPIKALKVVEALCMAYENRNPGKEQAEKIISDIFRVVHSTDKDHSCYDIHTDWRKSVGEWFKGFQEIGFITKSKLNDK